MASTQWMVYLRILSRSAWSALSRLRLLIIATVVSLFSPLVIVSFFDDQGPFSGQAAAAYGWLSGNPVMAGVLAVTVTIGHIFAKTVFLTVISSSRSASAVFERSVRLFPRYFALDLLVLVLLIAFGALLSVPIRSIDESARLSTNLTILAYLIFILAALLLFVTKMFSAFYLTKSVGIRSAIELATVVFSRHIATITVFGMCFIVSVVAIAFVAGVLYDFLRLHLPEASWSQVVLSATLVVLNGYIHSFTILAWYAFFNRIARGHVVSPSIETSQNDERMIQREVSRENA